MSSPSQRSMTSAMRLPEVVEAVGHADGDLDAAVGRPEHPSLEFGPGLVDRVFEQVPERLLPSAGQIAGVLRHGVFDAAHAFDGLVVAVAARLVLQAFADLVERVGHPGDDVEPVEHAFGVRTPLMHAGNRSRSSGWRPSSATRAPPRSPGWTSNRAPPTAPRQPPPRTRGGPREALRRPVPP